MDFIKSALISFLVMLAIIALYLYVMPYSFNEQIPEMTQKQLASQAIQDEAFADGYKMYLNVCIDGIVYIVPKDWGTPTPHFNLDGSLTLCY